MLFVTCILAIILAIPIYPINPVFPNNFFVNTNSEKTITISIPNIVSFISDSFFLHSYLVTKSTIAVFKPSNFFSASSSDVPFTPIYNLILGSVPDGLTAHQLLFSNA